MWKRSIILAVAFSLAVLSGWNAVYASSSALAGDPMNTARHLINDDVRDDEIYGFLRSDPDYIIAVFDAGMDHFGVPEDKQREALQLVRSRMAALRDGLPEIAGGCTQNVEMENGTNGKASCYQYVADQWCDGSDPDTDYRFHFNPQWAYNSDNIRWYAKSGWVRTVFLSWYGGNLLGSSLCTSPIQLCIGSAVWAAGGPGNVKQEMWIWSR